MVYPDNGDFHLQELFDRMRNDYEAEAEAKGLKMEVSGGDLVVYSDPDLLERILRNLMSNAIRYTEQGEVTLKASPMGAQISIEVTDTGIGIPKESHHEIFREFYQLGNPERDRTKGLGLGLAIVERLTTSYAAIRAATCGASVLTNDAA